MLIVLCIAAVAWLVALMSGMGRGVHWRVPLPAATLPVALRPTTEIVVPPLDAMRVAWERPLFEPARRMVSVPVSLAETAEMKLIGLMLTGTVRAGPLQVALMKDASGKDVRIPVGSSYQGWTLVSLESRLAIFRNGEATDEVTFPPQNTKSPGAAVADGRAASQPIDAGAETGPMMTTEAESRTPVSAASDDTAVRQARLESMKDMVARRRAESSDQAGGH